MARRDLRPSTNRPRGVRAVLVAAVGALLAAAPAACGGDPVTPAGVTLRQLTERLGDPDAGRRSAALAALGDCGSAADPAVPAVERVLREDPQASVRSAAARCLGRIGTRGARDALFDAWQGGGLAEGARAELLTALAELEPTELTRRLLERAAAAPSEVAAAIERDPVWQRLPDSPERTALLAELATAAATLPPAAARRLELALVQRATELGPRAAALVPAIERAAAPAPERARALAAIGGADAFAALRRAAAASDPDRRGAWLTVVPAFLGGPAPVDAAELAALLATEASAPSPAAPRGDAVTALGALCARAPEAVAVALPALLASATEPDARLGRLAVEALDAALRSAPDRLRSACDALLPRGDAPSATQVRAVERLARLAPIDPPAALAALQDWLAARPAAPAALLDAAWRVALPEPAGIELALDLLQRPALPVGASRARDLAAALLARPGGPDRAAAIVASTAAGLPVRAACLAALLRDAPAAARVPIGIDGRARVARVVAVGADLDTDRLPADALCLCVAASPRALGAVAALRDRGIVWLADDGSVAASHAAGAGPAAPPTRRALLLPAGEPAPPTTARIALDVDLLDRATR
ncbi:MAG: HEAT repeat domain-containing protein [Planctomycetes bacterium]|nr:HEAT repeat domain-containing protein [Planctomycetota bacterium]